MHISIYFITTLASWTKVSRVKGEIVENGEWTQKERKKYLFFL